MNLIFDIKINNYPVVMLFWNVFLALIPCFLGYWIFKISQTSFTFRRFAWLASLFIIWFFFFPNTAYLFTEIRYLVDYCVSDGGLRTCPEAAWIPPFFFFYASIGIPTFVYALQQVHHAFENVFGKKWGRLFPLLMIPATSIGTLLGLVDRFNSWDMIHAPWQILKIGLGYIVDPIMAPNFWAYTLLMFFLYYFIPYTFRYVSHDSCSR